MGGGGGKMAWDTADVWTLPVGHFYSFFSQLIPVSTVSVSPGSVSFVGAAPSTGQYRGGPGGGHGGTDAPGEQDFCPLSGSSSIQRVIRYYCLTADVCNHTKNNCVCS